MRHRAILMVLTFVALQTVSPATGSRDPAVTLYDPNPVHIWNRLHAVLLLRVDANGVSYGSDSPDPLLWQNSTYLLAQPSHQRALHVLDEFLQTHAENLIRDPVKRAILQCDLWAIFDWSVEREPERPEEPDYAHEKRELQVRLAQVLRRIALTSKEIESLPDNYAQAVASGNFGKAYDPANQDRAFLPPDLFEQHGSWVNIDAAGDPEPVTPQHLAAVSGRFRFLVFMRLPAGRKATFDYLRTLWEFPQPWVVRPDAPKQTETNPNLPSFPVGTEVALVRQMTLFDNFGNLLPAPITESVQIRVYRTTGASTTRDASVFDEMIARSGQDFYEIRLGRQQLFAKQAGGLRIVGPSEREFFTFNAHGDDQIESSGRRPSSQYPPIIKMCAECHRGSGINSLNTREKLLKPGFLRTDPSWTNSSQWWENDGTTWWKQQRYDWGLLNGYWAASERLH